MLYILFGEDDFSLNQSLKEIKESIGTPDLLEANTTVLDGTELSLDHLRLVCSTVPFLTERRLVIAIGLLKRFEVKRRQPPRQKSTPPGQTRENGHRLFATVINEIPESTVLVLVDDNIKNDNPFLRTLRPHARLHIFPRLSGDKLIQWIERQVAAAAGTISPAATKLLSHLIGSNLWIMSSEINKLVLYTVGRRIEENDVTTLVSEASKSSVFTMIDAVLAARADIAEQQLERLLQIGEAPAFLLFMLARQMQLLVRMKELRAQGKPRAYIQQKLGLHTDFTWRKTLEESAHYNMPRIKEVYRKILETDIATKTGKYNGELALNILFAELCQPD